MRDSLKPKLSENVRAHLKKKMLKNMEEEKNSSGQILKRKSKGRLTVTSPLEISSS